MQITRRLEFDAGHRIPNHKSQCRHLHGHRYVLEVSLEGQVVADPNSPEDGMVADFGDVKALAKEQIVDVWDHAFLVWKEDTVVANFLASLEGHKTVFLNVVPTAENLAHIAFETLAPLYRNIYGDRLRLARVRIYETPNCWADAAPITSAVKATHGALK